MNDPTPATWTQREETAKPATRDILGPLIATGLHSLAEHVAAGGDTGLAERLVAAANVMRRSHSIDDIGRFSLAAATESRTAARPDAMASLLTERECEVAQLAACGFNNRQIADVLVIATSTAERHMANILNKLGVCSRAQVAAWAVEHGLVRVQ